MDDLGIVELYFERDEQAIRETEIKYGRLCHRIAYNILNNQEDSEECVNDTYVGVWHAIPPTRPGNFKSFVCRIARNLSLKRLDYMKREKRSKDVLLSLDELASVLPDERYAPNISDENIGELISRFLRTQKEDVRNIFLRRYFFFDSIADIAQHYSFTESKVKNMLFRTRKKLHDYLIKEGVEASFVEDDQWYPEGRKYISFTITSGTIGVYKVGMHVSADGYLWTNSLGWQYLFHIGENAAGKIIRYAKDDSIVAEYEPYYPSVAGKIIEITDEYILIDDSILCKDSEKGIVYKVLLHDIRVTHYIDYHKIHVNDIVQVAYEAGDYEPNSHTISSVVSISGVILSDGNTFVTE